jgi:hypothetical protein
MGFSSPDFARSKRECVGVFYNAKCGQLVSFILVAALACAFSLLERVHAWGPPTPMLRHFELRLRMGGEWCLLVQPGTLDLTRTTKCSESSRRNMRAWFQLSTASSTMRIRKTIYSPSFITNARVIPTGETLLLQDMVYGTCCGIQH